MPKQATIKQKKAIKHLLEKGGSVGGAMRIAGYSEATIKNPQHLTKSLAYREIMDRTGMDDEYLANIHKNMLDSFETVEEIFRPVAIGKGKKTKYIELSDTQIEVVILAKYGSGARYSIVDDPHESGRRTAYVRVPNLHQRGRGLEMAYKNKGLFGQSIFDIPPEEASPEEKRNVSLILKINKK